MKEQPDEKTLVIGQSPLPKAAPAALRAVTLAPAALSTGLVAGVFYAFAVSVNPGLAAQPDASYGAIMNAINERIETSLFFASFLGAVLFLLAALAVHYSPRPRSGRFWLVAADVVGPRTTVSSNVQNARHESGPRRTAEEEVNPRR